MNHPSNPPAPGALGREALVPAEARSHQGHRAGFISRSIAAALDLGVVLFLLGLGYVGWSMARFVLDPHGFSFPTPSTGLQLLFFEVVSVSYLTLSWCAIGYSQGQQVMGLRVSGRDGRKPGVVRSFVRSLVCVLFPVGLLWVLFSRRRHAFHDLVVGSSVTYAWTSARQ